MCGFSDACSTLYQEMVCWVGWQTKSNHTIKGSKERASKLNTEAMRYLHRHRQCFNCLGSQELALHTQILDRIKYIAVGCIASQNQSNIIKPRQSQSLKTAMPSASKLRHARTHTKLSLALSLIGKACCEWSWLGGARIDLSYNQDHWTWLDRMPLGRMMPRCQPREYPDNSEHLNCN